MRFSLRTTFDNIVPDTEPIPSSARLDRSTGLFPWSVALIVVGALAVRVGYLLLVARPLATFTGIDPDGYMDVARHLAPPGGQWRWSLEAVRFIQYVKAPLYPVLLSGLALVSFRWANVLAAFAQALAGAGAVGLVYINGRLLHSHRAGIIGAALYGVWLSNIVSSHIFLQEHFYVPLVLAALALVAYATDRPEKIGRWIGAGTMLGLAALVRSLPLYFIALLAPMLLMVGRRKGIGARQVVALLAGFGVVTVPWCIYISRQMGQLVPIENIGAVHFPVAYPESRTVVHHTAPAPTVFETVSMVARVIVSEPVSFARDRLYDLLGLLQLRGGRWLQSSGMVHGEGAALLKKAVAHGIGDAPFLLSCSLAPLGYIAARRRTAANVFGFWVAVNLSLVSLFTFSGARYRAPVEPVLVILASAALSRQPRRAPRAAWMLGSLAGVASAAAVLLSAPSSVHAGAPYGVLEWRGHGERRGLSRGDAGFTVLPVDGFVRFAVARLHGPTSGIARVDVWIDRTHVDWRILKGNEQRAMTYRWERSFPPYVEIQARDEYNRPAAVEFQAGKLVE